MGVTSLIRVTSSPTPCSARIAVSRPAPGPFTNTSTRRRPCSMARRAACSEAICAANGVPLRVPLNMPTLPELAQERTAPWVSDIVTMVLLNVDCTCTMPVTTFFFSFDFGLPAELFVVCLFAMRLLLLLRLLLARYRPLWTLADARVCLRPLAAHGQAAPMAQSAVTADLLQPPDAQPDLAAQVALDGVLPLQHLAHAGRLVIGHLANTRVRIDAGDRHNLSRARKSDAEDIGKRVFNSFVARKIHASYTCQTNPPSDSGSTILDSVSARLPGRRHERVPRDLRATKIQNSSALPLFVLGIDAYDAYHSLALNDFALLADLLDGRADFHFMSLTFVAQDAALDEQCGAGDTKTRGAAEGSSFHRFPRIGAACSGQALFPGFMVRYA